MLYLSIIIYTNVDNCQFSTSSDILNKAKNGGAVCFSYKQPYETEQGNIEDNYQTKSYTIGTDRTISEGFTYNTLNRTINIHEKWSAAKSWHCYYPCIVVNAENKKYIAESKLFESDKRLFVFPAILCLRRMLFVPKDDMNC